MTTTINAPSDLRVMSFNIRYANEYDKDNLWVDRKDVVAEVIREANPVVFGVQEAYRFQLDDITAGVPGYTILGEGRDGGREGEYSAILYREDRLELKDSGTFWLSENPAKPSRNWGSACRRICSWAYFTDRYSGQSFCFYNTHLDHKSQEARERGIRLILEHIEHRASKDSIILMGDLNVEEDDAVISMIRNGTEEGLSKNGLIDTFRSLHPEAEDVGTHHRFQGNRDGKRIDYIFVSRDIQAMTAEAVRHHRDGVYPSDHFPVTAVLRFKDTP